MPTYVYIAKSEPQKTLQGEIEAETEQEAISKLTQRGYFPISVQAKDVYLEKKELFRFRKITNQEIAIFSRQLSSLIEAGINVINGLEIISRQTANKYLKIILSEVIAKIKDGKSLSDSLAIYPQTFSSLYTAMIHSAEISGTLPETSKRLADFLEKEEEFRSSLRAALMYPIFVLFVGVLTVVILLGFVIPRLVTMFSDMGQILPMPTRILIGVSGFFHSWGWLILAILATLIFFIRRTYHSAQGRLFWDNFKLKLAIFGSIILKTQISRLMRTLSLLLSSGITIIYALDIVTSIIENQVLRQEVGKFKEQISGGASFSQCLINSSFFPIFVTNIVKIGEETGKLEISLLRIAEDYEKEVDRSLKALARLIEPIIILGVGLIVGFIVLSMLLPIFQINLIVR
jgi:type II secretory pathway component PulF